MIRKLLAALGVTAALALPGAAQTFTHTINGVTHAHDITTYRTVGTCCVQTCGCSGMTVSTHHPHSSTCGTTTRTYTHAPSQTRRYTRTYTHAPVTRTYSQTYTSAPTVTRRVYVTPPRTIEPSYHYEDYRTVYHDDRAQPYAHYDRRWKSRTRGYARGHRHH